MPFDIDRRRYAALYGPTRGDRVRLADTELIVEVEDDRTVYGEEVKFGGGKTIRDGMGQSATATDVPDTVITNALIVDHWGIVKADVGIKDGLIRAIGKAGNPDVMPGVDPLLVIGVGTDVIAGEGLILSAGGIDAHIHFIAPQQITEAIRAIKAAADGQGEQLIGMAGATDGGDVLFHEACAELGIDTEVFLPVPELAYRATATSGWPGWVERYHAVLRRVREGRGRRTRRKTACISWPAPTGCPHGCRAGPAIPPGSGATGGSCTTPGPPRLSTG